MMLLSMACLSACARTRFHVAVPVREVAMLYRLLCCSLPRVWCAPSPVPLRALPCPHCPAWAGCGGDWGVGSAAAPSEPWSGCVKIGGPTCGQALVSSMGGV